MKGRNKKYTGRWNWMSLDHGWMDRDLVVVISSYVTNGQGWLYPKEIDETIDIFEGT